jgi:PAS domain S-box-containing protein
MPLSTSPPKPAFDLLQTVALAAGALLVQWALAPWLGPQPFMLIEPAIIFTAATLGRWPAALVMLVGAVNAVVAMRPVGLWLVSDPADQLAIAAYLVIGALLIAYGGRLRLRNARAERAEQRLSLAQDETGVGLFELDYRDQTAYASPALCQMLGQPVMPGSMPLQRWLDALNAGHVADSRRTMQAKVAAGELRYERELHIALPDGQQRWLLSRVRLDLDDHGELAAARGATLDISARKQLVTELEAAQSQLRQQLDDLGRLHSLGNRLLATPVLDAGLQEALEAVCSFYDTRYGLVRLREPGRGSRVVAHCGLSPEALQRLAPPDAALESDRLCGPAARSGRRKAVADIEQDESLLELQPLARALGVRSVHNTPLVAAGEGQVVGVLTVLGQAVGLPGERLMRLTDLCAAQALALIEREQALSLAREAQQRFEVALQSSSVAFSILAPVRDEAGQIVDFAWSYANPAAAALIGRSAHELRGRHILDVLPQAWDEPGFFDRYVRVVEHGDTAEFDTQTHRPGRKRWLHVIASPLNGLLVVWFADITQRREEQQALQDADRRKDEFLATLAHELRNPLAPIRHAAEIIGDPAASAAQRDWSVAVIERQLQRMALLLDDLLDVSRITRGTLPLRRERCELKAIVESAVETAHPLFSERRHSLVLALPDAPVWLDVDPLRIGQVLANLLVNAAKYTAPGGRVVLGARREGADVVIDVTDNGQGLRPEDCKRVFDMFVQLPTAKGRAQGGLGIGLALARSLMGLHGGRLEASSAGPGQGCTFKARLPAAAADARSAPLPAAPDAEAGTPPASPRGRILIADDNRDAADSLAMLLALDGYEVQVAYDGREALARCGSFQPHVALLDMSMPEGSGAEVAASIRDQRAREPITLIAITGLGQQRDRLNALAAGFDHCLTKPVEWARLKALLADTATSPN